MYNDDTGVTEMLNDLLNVIEDSSVPKFGNSNMRLIDYNVVMDLINSCLSMLPSELEHSRQVMRQAESIISNANTTATSIINDAHAQALNIASEAEIMRIATQMADEVRSKAEIDSAQMRSGAEQYADETIARVQETLEKELNVINRCRERLNAPMINNRAQYTPEYGAAGDEGGQGLADNGAYGNINYGANAYGNMGSAQQANGAPRDYSNNSYPGNTGSNRIVYDGRY